MAKNDNPQARRLLESMTAHGEEEAGQCFAEAHPLGKSADIRKKFAWAQSLCAFLDERYDEETVKAIRMDCACGPSAGQFPQVRALYAQEKDPQAFAEGVNRLDLGFSLTWDGTGYILEYPMCYCSCVRRTDAVLPRSWCWCTLGYNKRLFESILGREVQVDLLASVKQGDETCRIRITPSGT